MIIYYLCFDDGLVHLPSPVCIVYFVEHLHRLLHPPPGNQPAWALQDQKVEQGAELKLNKFGEDCLFVLLRTLSEINVQINSIQIDCETVA